MSKSWHTPEDAERYGFRYGPAVVTRAFHDQRIGYCIQIATEQECLDVYVSPRGHRIRVFKRTKRQRMKQLK